MILQSTSDSRSWEFAKHFHHIIRRHGPDKIQRQRVNSRTIEMDNNLYLTLFPVKTLCANYFMISYGAQGARGLEAPQILLCLAEAVKAASKVLRSASVISLLSGPPRLPSPAKTSPWKRSRNCVGNFHLSSRSRESLRWKLPTMYFPITGKNLNALERKDSRQP